MITAGRVYQLHRGLVATTGEPATVLHDGCVERGVGAATQAMVYLGEDPVMGYLQSTPDGVGVLTHRVPVAQG